MRVLLRGGSAFRKGRFERTDVAIDGARIARLAVSIDPSNFDSVYDCSDLLIVPGFVDVHVHLREPGFSYKETIATGTAAAARGGYSAVCAMPNLHPTPDSPEHLREQLALIARDAAVRVYPYGTITRGQAGRGELVDFAALMPEVCGFSDDGRGVQHLSLMREAMERVAALGGLIAAHCEDEAELTPGGCVHDGAFARRHGLVGISSKSEWAMVERDLRLVEETGCRYHVCHVSSAESVALIRRAKASGLPVSCETAPHYLLLTDDDLQDDGRFKMNPPIRSAADRDALIAGLIDGTIDMIATDHAPHSAAEKAGGLRNSVMGIVGLETAFPLLYARLVLSGVLSLEQLIDKMSVAPRRVFGLDNGGGVVEVGAVADLALLDIRHRSRIDPESFASLGRATPFAGWEASGRAAMTMVGGEVVHEVRD